MATSDGKVVIETEVDDSGAKSGMNKLGSTLGKVGSTAVKGAAIAIGAVSTAIVGLGVSAVKYNASMEQYQTSFEVMTGSAEKAVSIMNEIKDISAKTPFETTDVVKATQNLMAFGFSADEALSSFSMLGDLSQGNAQKLESYTLALGKMQSSQKVTLESLNLMIENGFNPLTLVADKTGESMADLYDRVSAGKVSIDEIKDAMVTATSAGGQFYQSMDKQSQTLGGKLSTLKDNFQQLTGTIFASTTVEVGGAVDTATKYVDALAKAFEENGMVGMAEALGNIFLDLQKSAIENAPELINMAIGIITSITSGISENADILANGLVQIISALGSGIIEILPDLLNIGMTILMALMSGMTQNADAIANAIVTVLLMLVDFIIANLSTGIEFVITVITAIATALAENMPIIIEKLPELIEAIVIAILNNLPLLIGALITIVMALARALIEAMPLLVESLGEMFQSIYDYFIEQGPSMRQKTVELFGRIIAGFLEIKGKILESTGEFITDIINKYKESFSNFKSIGKGIVENIFSGISEKWDWLKAKLSELIKNIPGINSILNGDTGGTKSQSSFSGQVSGSSAMNQLQNAVQSTLSNLQFNATMVGSNRMAEVVANPQQTTVLVDFVGGSDGLFEVVAQKDDLYYNRTGNSRFYRRTV